MSPHYGPSDRIRTCGILLPKQARYQLRYTRLFSCFIRLGVFSQIKRDTTFATPGFFCAVLHSADIIHQIELRRKGFLD